MDFVKNAMSAAGGSGNNNNNNGDNNNSGGSGGGLMGMVNNAAGGGAQGEKNEDLVDKGVDFVQEKFLGGGDQSNESAAEQAKDEMISDGVRSAFKSVTGKDIPIADK